MGSRLSEHPRFRTQLCVSDKNFWSWLQLCSKSSKGEWYILSTGEKIISVDQNPQRQKKVNNVISLICRIYLRKIMFSKNIIMRKSPQLFWWQIPKRWQQQHQLQPNDQISPSLLQLVHLQKPLWFKLKPLSLLWLPLLYLKPLLQHQGQYPLNLHLLVQLNKRKLHKSHGNISDYYSNTNWCHIRRCFSVKTF